MSVPVHKPRGGCHVRVSIGSNNKTCRLDWYAQGRGDIFDITYEERQKIEPEEVRNTEVQEMIVSKIVPDLYFWQFQGSIEVNGHFKDPTRTIWKLLLFLEYCGWSADQEDVRGKCWRKRPTAGALRSAVKRTNQFLGKMGVGQTVRLEECHVVWN